MKSRRTLLVGLVALAAASVAGAQEAYPARPVRIIVPWGPGSGIDVQTRAFAEAFSRQLGAPVVIDNRSGAGSHLGFELAAQAKPDGYTLFVGSNAQFIYQFMRSNNRYELLKDMAPVTQMCWLPQVLVVAPGSPAKDLPGLIALARAKPGKLNYGSGGVGSGSHVLASAIATRNRIDVVHVPLRTLTNDLVPMLDRGDIHFAFPITSLAAGPLKQGSVRALAVTSRTRLRQFPDVPTLAEEFGDPRYATDSWTGLFVPAGTPHAIVQKLFEAASRAVDSPQHLSSAETLFTTAVKSRSPSDFGEFLRAEAQKWRDIVRDSGAQAD
jgi:tripartite-type tricarboxylate transporter receptor subunit TctC